MSMAIGHTVTLIAEFTKMRFEGDGFQIITMKTHRNNALVPAEVDPGMEYPAFCAKGYFSPPDFEGQTFEVTGEWRYDKIRKEYAFFVSFLIPALPTTPIGCEQFIRKNVKGIGKKTAQRIVAEWGTDLVKATADPDILAAKVKGLTRSRAVELGRVVEAMSSIAKLTRMLRDAVGGETIRKIAMLYGNEALDMVQKNPYSLALTIGFHEADKIALALGGTYVDKERILAALECAFYALRTRQGAIIINRVTLFRKAEQSLNKGLPAGTVTSAVIDQTFAILCQEKKFYAAPGEKGYVYLYDDYAMEVKLAKRVVELAVNEGRNDDERRYLEKYKGWLKAHQSMKLAANQDLAVRIAAKQKLSIVTGGPGTGKTTVLKAIMETYQNAFPNSPITLMAPTGLAAKRMSDSCGMRAFTIHKRLGLVPAQNASGFVAAQDARIPGGLVVIDEYSMVGIHLTSFIFDSIDLRDDTRIVLVGDIDQLPSVSPGFVLDDFIRCQQIPVTRLNRNFRQEAGSNIINVAYAVNSGDFAELKFAGDCDFCDVSNPDIVRETEQIVEKLKAKFLDGIKEYGLSETFILSPTHHCNAKNDRDAYRYALCTDNLNLILQELVNPASADKGFYKSGNRVFREGDRVMNNKNTEECINGDIGIIKNISNVDGVPTLIIEFGDGTQIEYLPDKVKNLELAYAITVHKSQGCEFAYVLMPASLTQEIMLERNLLYTGVTRAKKQFHAIGNMEAIKQAVKYTPPKQYKELLGLRIVRYMEAAKARKTA